MAQPKEGKFNRDHADLITFRITEINVGPALCAITDTYCGPDAGSATVPEVYLYHVDAREALASALSAFVATYQGSPGVE